MRQRRSVPRMAHGMLLVVAYRTTMEVAYPGTHGQRIGEPAAPGRYTSIKEGRRRVLRIGPMQHDGANAGF